MTTTCWQPARLFNILHRVSSSLERKHPSYEISQLSSSVSVLDCEKQGAGELTSHKKRTVSFLQRKFYWRGEKEETEERCWLEGRTCLSGFQMENCLSICTGLTLSVATGWPANRGGLGLSYHGALALMLNPPTVRDLMTVKGLACANRIEEWQQWQGSTSVWASVTKLMRTITVISARQPGFSAMLATTHWAPIKRFEPEVGMNRYT